MQHELLRILLDQPVDALLVAAGAQRHGHQRLGLAALEHGRTVDPRQHVDLAGDRAQLLVAAAVGPGAGEDQVADDAAFQLLPGRGKRLLGRRTTAGSGTVSASAFSLTAWQASARASLPMVCLAARKAS